MIEVSRVSKVYASPAGPVSVLQDLDLTVAPSETVAIVGPSGSGKTTLLNLLGAMDRPTSGTISMDGGWDEDPAAVRARATSLLEQVGLSHRLTHRPWQLSGGEQLRVAIARALINRPKVILADEPTGSLDPATGERIAELLLRTNQGAHVALIVVTHNPGLARRMQRTYRLDGGRLVA
jgi:predicted ABC-type transport system involved in lysophospholipase L1 biosynthesis ATPase subunit